MRTVPAGPGDADVERLAAAGISTDVSVRRGCWSLLGGTEGGTALRQALERAGRGVGGSRDARRGGARGRRRGHGVARRHRGGDGGGRARDAAIAAVVGPPGRIVVAGGWTASAMLLDAKRRRLGPLVVARAAEAGALGAATLAARATGPLGRDDRLAP